MNQESGRALLDAIRTHGIENISLVAKRAGLHVETARYGIWHEMPSHGITIDVEFNFELMGLERWILHLSFSGRVQAKAIFDFLKNETGAIYGTEVLPTGRILAVIMIPTYEQHRLQRILDWLILMNYIEAYELQKMNWFRPVSLNLDCYDIREGAWSIDWDSVEKSLPSKKRLAIPRSQNTRTPSVVDHKDLLIIQRLQIKLPSAISKLAKSAGLDQFNARYHYNNHVKRYVKGYNIKAKQNSAGKRNPDVSILFSYAPKEMTDLVEVRACALSLPFTTAEWESDNSYGWSIACPQEYITSTFRYVSKHTFGLRSELKYEMLDDAREFKQAIPGQMFDEAQNRWRFEPKLSLSLFHTSFETLRSRCQYYKSTHCTYEGKGKTHPCKLVACAFARK